VIDTKKLIPVSFVISYLLVLVPLGIIWSGFVLTNLWAWFIVPSFGVPALSIPAAVGLTIIASYLTHKSGIIEDGKGMTEKIITSTTHMALKPALSLALGWVVAQWM